MSDDRSILVAALQSAVTAFRAAHPNPTLLGPGPDRNVLEALSAAIERCAAYQGVAGQMVFSGGSGPVLHSGPLASLLFSKGGWPSENVEGAVDWLLKVLRTRKATVLVKAAIWGMQLDQAVTVRDNAKLVPFDALPNSYMKDRIKARARSCHDGSAWMAPTYYDLPDAAYVEKVANFPYIGGDGAAFQRMNDLEQRLNDIVVLLQATAAGRPIAVACWFEYRDHDLEYAERENAFSWLLPEVHPKVVRGDAVSGAKVQTNIANFDALPSDRRAAVLRSMERFRLSQCRRQGIDRLLDLTLAFEIAVSGPGGEQSPPSYKVGVRTVQAIGGPLQDRQQWRTTVGELYKLRNQATHGGQLKVKEAKALDRIVDSSSAIYLQLMTKLLTIATAPDWPAIELEALAAP